MKLFGFLRTVFSFLFNFFKTLGGSQALSAAVVVNQYRKIEKGTEKHCPLEKILEEEYFGEWKIKKEGPVKKIIFPDGSIALLKGDRTLEELHT